MTFFVLTRKIIGIFFFPFSLRSGSRPFRDGSFDADAYHVRCCSNALLVVSDFFLRYEHFGVVVVCNCVHKRMVVNCINQHQVCHSLKLY